MKISVYITSYNYSEYLKQSIESVLAQNFEDDYELIIIDDGSTDNSRDIINLYSNNNKIKIIFQEKKGLNISNNIAINISSGEYILRLDADDYLDKNALGLLSKSLDNNKNAAMVFSDYYIVDQDGEILSLERRHDFKKSVSLFDQPAHGACTMFRKHMLVEVGGYWTNFDRQDGYDIWLKMIKSYEIENLNLPLFYYRQHSKNLTKNKHDLYETRANIIEQSLNFQNKNFNLDTVAIILSRGYGQKNCIELKKLNNTNLIELKIKQLKNTKNVKKIIVSTQNSLILDYIKSRFNNIILDYRPKKLSSFNSRLEDTIDYIFEKYNSVIKPYENFLISNVETPFLKSFYIDKCISVLNLYEVDSVMGVIKEDANFYNHKGAGMVPLFKDNTLLSLEKDFIYRQVIGLRAFKKNKFLKSKTLSGEKVGHILIDEISSFNLNSDFSWKLAEFIDSKIMNSE